MSPGVFCGSASRLRAPKLDVQGLLATREPEDNTLRYNKYSKEQLGIN